MITGTGSESLSKKDMDTFFLRGKGQNMSDFVLLSVLPWGSFVSLPKYPLGYEISENLCEWNTDWEIWYPKLNKIFPW